MYGKLQGEYSNLSHGWRILVWKTIIEVSLDLIGFLSTIIKKRLNLSQGILT